MSSEVIVLRGGRLYFDAINRMEAVVPRWGESGVDPLADIKKFYDEINDRVQKLPSSRGKTDASNPHVRYFLEGDYTQLEMYALLAMLEHESDPVILDLSPRGGSLPGLNELVAGLLKREKCAAPLPSRPDYHKHDKTKNHRRPRR